MATPWRERFQPYTPSPREEPSQASPMLDRLVRASGGHCGICGKVNTLWLMDIDHVLPKARGGINERNRVPAHRICNRKKADRLPTGCERLWLDVVNTRLVLA